ncbi:hypothetical protein KY285_000818 [Solanum tuberosum]|nr:hypothetical protein KY289_001004 [Solanum tuberosum]KAH0764947.1 hypothetical protein KY285_000818 [Solanum tuberosum]
MPMHPCLLLQGLVVTLFQSFKLSFTPATNGECCSREDSVLILGGYSDEVHEELWKLASYAPAYSMNDEFSRVLHQQMEFFSSK